MNLSESDRLKIRGIAKAHNLSLVILYGSRAKGRARPSSDTDIAVKANRLLETTEILKLEAAIDKLFTASEVIDIRTAPILLLASIAQDGILLYESEASLFSEFKIQSISQYTEYKPYFLRRRNKIKEIIAGY